MLKEEIMHARVRYKEGLTLGRLKQVSKVHLWNQTQPKTQGFCYLRKFHEELDASGKT